MGISPSGIVNLPTEKALKMWHPGIEEHVAALDPHFADYCYTRGCCVILASGCLLRFSGPRGGSRG